MPADSITQLSVMGSARAEWRQHNIPVVFPMHPRTQMVMRASSFLARLVRIIPPQGYVEFLRFMLAARLVLTDSGGIQEETTILGVPCLTVRENTERPITITHGTNRLVGTDRNTFCGRPTSL